MTARYRPTPESRLFDAVLGGLVRLFGGRKSAAKPLSMAYDRSYVRAEWSKIGEIMKQGGESRFQQAVVAADKLLDYVLRALVPGETLGERLRNGRSVFTSEEAYQAAWSGHKLRNRLVHEVNYQTISWEAQEAVRAIEKALRDLGAL